MNNNYLSDSTFNFVSRKDTPDFKDNSFNVLRVSVRTDYLNGNNGNDKLFGLAGNDVLNGFRGDDYPKISTHVGR